MMQPSRLYILLGFLLLSFAQLRSQPDFSNLFLNFGYNFGYSKMDALNAVLEEYNAGHSLKNKFKEAHWPNGFYGSVGSYYGPVFVQLGYGQSQVNPSATYLNADSTTTFQQDVRLSASTFHFGTGFGGSLNRYVVVGAGGTIEAGNLVAKLRNGTKSGIKKEAWETPLKKRLYQSTFFMHFMLGNNSKNTTLFYIEPYYTIAYGKLDLSKLETALGQVDTGARAYDASHFGIKLALTTYINL